LIQPKESDDFKEKVAKVQAIRQETLIATTDNLNYRRQNQRVKSIYDERDPVMYYFNSIIKPIENVNNSIEFMQRRETEAKQHRLRLCAKFGIIDEKLRDAKKTDL
jgi:hypothetical protein